MNISAVCSYGNAWNLLLGRYAEELNSIRNVVHPLNVELDAVRAIKTLWDSYTSEENWEHVSKGGQMHACYKNGIGMVLSPPSWKGLHGDVDLLSFLVEDFAEHQGDLKLIVALAPTQRSNRPSNARRTYTRLKRLFINNAPLSHPYPIAIVGISPLPAPLEIVEIPSSVPELQAASVELRTVIDRSIEFAPEYHQAGIGILSYFGTVLRQKYPNEKARVRIEQDGLRVRLVVESEGGHREIIERALQEYELVVRGEMPAEKIFEDRMRILELKNEIRAAEFKIASMKDVIEFQKATLDGFHNAVGRFLSSEPRSISISVSPSIVVSSSANGGLTIPPLVEQLRQLAETSDSDAGVRAQCAELAESLEILEGASDTTSVKDSVGIKKLKRFLDEAESVGSSAHAFFNRVGDGIGMLRKLAKSYNSIAEWCGAPQVPRILVGQD